MNSVEAYFSDIQIIEQLCKRRIKQASKRHEKSYVARLAGISYRQPEPKEVDDLLPPRSVWNQYRPRFRQNSREPNLQALIHATRCLMQDVEQPWVRRLGAFTSAVREKAMNTLSPHFDPPNMFWELKKDHVYRPISHFGLMDSIIWSLFSKYLTDFFDPVYSSRSFACRSRENPEMPTRESAIDSLFSLRQSTKSDLYVAECDIQGFFDCVEHGVAMNAFESNALLVAAEFPDRQLHPRARFLFHKYLNCYTFPENVWNEALERLREEDPEGIFKWPVEALERLWCQDPRELRIGVPQGGAVSGVIANLVLNIADRQIEAVNTNDRLHYFRYCDDTLFVSPNRSQCGRALASYLTVLEKLKLPFHPPKHTWIYDKAFWGRKSKSPYCWSGRKWFGCVPWVQFIGYQMRYDGLMRVRKDSIEKQRKRIREIVDQAKFGLIRVARHGKTIQSIWEHAVWGVYRRLACAGVGRVRKGQTAIPMPKSWIGGFKALHEKPIATRSLQLLDRERERQARRFKRAQIEYRPKRWNYSHAHKSRPTDFTGSYYAQFQNCRGRELVTNPYKAVSWLEKHVLDPVYHFCRRVVSWAVSRTL